VHRALVLAAALAAFALPLPLTAAGKAHTVRMEGIKFVPERLEVAPGDSVTWVNADLVPHTVTAAGASIESGSIAPKGSWKWVAGRKPGEIRYVCRFHPGMQATLVIK
jgi:plastocyanin